MAKGKSFNFQMPSNTQSTIGKSLKAEVRDTISILPELEHYIRKLKPEEFAQLERSVQEEGCHDPLKIWKKNDDELYIIDGHHRFEICKKHAIEFKVEYKYYASLEEVKEYMIQLQLGRRNLNSNETSYYRGLHYNMHKSTENLGRAASGGKLAQKLAELHGIGEKTIRRDASIAAVVDALPTIERVLYLTGEASYTRTKMLEAAKQLDEILDLVAFLKGDSSTNQEVIQPRERDINYLGSYISKIDSQVKSWNKNLDTGEKQELISYLESVLNQLKK
ncbi:hypothetical protein EI427_22020 [Flammeovirga pectinis]|uniref:ParB-like N-terminal domain-containing protein n=1 Tax=Flammeovirga pectinis TaxID=2494373 RepID=A0A3S9P9M9_9BACT|nr:ParB/RepB/Spo0J family partition protein [Flammeovirga pectinis]AZQ64906.1 hypothetical protein EI427_22020 [Flammeovirga pectinis]